jgi:hypothetical protein
MNTMLAPLHPTMTWPPPMQRPTAAMIHNVAAW